MGTFFTGSTSSKARKHSGFLVASGVLLVLITACFSDSRDTTPWTVVANCSTIDVSLAATTGIANPYYNGFRLVRDSYTYVRSGTTRETVHDYLYDVRTISRIQRAPPSSSGWVSSHRQNFDENGYLTGGSRLTFGGASIGFGHSYSFHYGADGQIESYDIAQSREATFVRNQGRLDAINFYNDAGEITDTITYRYDEQSQLVSAFDSTIDLKFLYRCNDQNQMTDVYTNRIYSDGDIRRDDHHKIVYDEHGNLIKITTPSSGDLGATRTYEYQQTDELVFNHWLMRLSNGFVWKAADLID